jgi:ankyrin repeat protein
MLLENGADVDSKDRENRTPLWWASMGREARSSLRRISKKKCEAVVRVLLEKGAKPPTVVDYGLKKTNLA